jgi:hypothetical protein
MLIPIHQPCFQNKYNNYTNYSINCLSSPFFIFSISKGRKFKFYKMQILLNGSKVMVLGMIILMTISCKKKSDDPNPQDATENYVIYNADNSIYVSVLKDLPDGESKEERKVYAIPSDWRFNALSLSPSGKYGTIALFSTAGANSKEYEGKIGIYNIVSNTLIKEYKKVDLIRLTEFTISEAAMLIVNMDWMDNDKLLIHMQPQTSWIGSLPQNVSLVVDVNNDQVIDKKNSNRNAPFLLRAPSHPSKTKYATEIKNNSLFIGGQKVKNLRPLGDYDVYFK